MEFYNNPLFLIPAGSGLIFIIAGWVMMMYPPKKINHLYGYRTPRSMKNQEYWDFAQKYSSKHLMLYGFYLSVLSVFGIVYQPDSVTAMILGLGMMIFTAILLILRTERAIKEKFGN